MARVRCEHCGREQEAGVGAGLSWGWPTCCHGHTMRLEAATEGEIQDGVREAMNSIHGPYEALRVAENFRRLKEADHPMPPPSGMR